MLSKHLQTDRYFQVYSHKCGFSVKFFGVRRDFITTATCGLGNFTMKYYEKHIKPNVH